MCENHDTKALYLKVRHGLIENITGVDSPSEPPISPFIAIDTANVTAEDAANMSYNNILMLIKHQK